MQNDSHKRVEAWKHTLSDELSAINDAIAILDKAWKECVRDDSYVGAGVLWGAKNRMVAAGINYVKGK